MSNFQDDINSIPLADDDPAVVIPEEASARGSSRQSLESLPSQCSAGDSLDSGSVTPDEHEEKARLISQVLELQNTLDDLSTRVDSVKEENLKLKSENQVLGQYIENLMSASSVFQSTEPKPGRKK